MECKIAVGDGDLEMFGYAYHYYNDIVDDELTLINLFLTAMKKEIDEIKLQFFDMADTAEYWFSSEELVKRTMVKIFIDTIFDPYIIRDDIEITSKVESKTTEKEFFQIHYFTLFVPF